MPFYRNSRAAVAVLDAPGYLDPLTFFRGPPAKILRFHASTSHFLPEITCILSALSPSICGCLCFLKISPITVIPQQGCLPNFEFSCLAKILCFGIFIASVSQRLVGSYILGPHDFSPLSVLLLIVSQFFICCFQIYEGENFII